MNFIETYDNALTSEMCKKIIDFFDLDPLQIKKEGETYLTTHTLGVNKNVKDSTDITMNFNQWTEPDQIIIYKNINQHKVIIYLIANVQMVVQQEFWHG